MACFAFRVSPSATVGMVFGMSKTVVTPPNAAEMVPLSKSSLWV